MNNLSGFVINTQFYFLVQMVNLAFGGCLFPTVCSEVVQR